MIFKPSPGAFLVLVFAASGCGFVASQVQIDKAVAVAKGVRGVREVQNKLSVKPG